ncbi:DUF4190 domain-containing protein [Streptomyces lavendulae]|uniref:DUF4190 domain-containing protein n=1 Tax=Streptomyces lavendulae TaxID=1914 RepID=UPI0024A544DC|nr:hypothetical protein [Streptomyces lavendulae]GLX23411.1 hypothetical protein Slala01_70550 [Streptomyces lavendulae subsp. lavendulae]GLX31293.1 hypothetical protein Slala02_71120 [Streptomyces lavendulae subsp. lavendulae]
MSTPPNPPGTPSGPPTEPEATPIPGAAKPSLEKTPPADAPPAQTPAPGSTAAEPEPEPTKPSLTKAPPADAPPADTPAPGTATPEPGPAKPSLTKTPQDGAPPAEPTAPAAPPTDTPAPETAMPEPAKPSLTKTPQDGAAPAEPPAPPAQTPAPAPAPEPEPAGPSLTKTPPTDAPPAQPPQDWSSPAEPAAPTVGEFNPWATPAPGAVPPPPPPAAAWGPPGQVPTAPYAAYPGYPGYPGYAAYQPVPPAPSNGMAVAALVLGLAAVPVALVPFVFWVGTILGVTAVALGIAAFVRTRAGAPRRVMSLFGVALGVIGLGASAGGWLFTVNLIDKAVDRAREAAAVEPDWDEDWEDGEDWEVDPLPTPPPGPGMTTPLDFGRTYTYPGGVKVTVEAPRKYTTGNKWIEVANAVEVPFTITNTSPEPLRVVHAIPEVRDGRGNLGNLVFDGRMPKRVDRVLEPGQTASGSAAYELPAGTTHIGVELSPGITLPPVKFSGPVGQPSNRS